MESFAGRPVHRSQERDERSRIGLEQASPTTKPREIHIDELGPIVGNLASWTVTNPKSHEGIEKALFSDRPECDQNQK